MPDKNILIASADLSNPLAAIFWVGAILLIGSGCAVVEDRPLLQAAVDGSANSETGDASSISNDALASEAGSLDANEVETTNDALQAADANVETGLASDAAYDSSDSPESLVDASAEAAVDGTDGGCAVGTRRCSGTCVPFNQQCSCIALGAICGPGFDENCCTRPLVPGGTFNRINDARYPATVSPFLLDRFEVTVGRFRNFVNAGLGTQAHAPEAGSGKNPNNAADQGWQSAWNPLLPVDTATLRSTLEDCPWSGWTMTGGDSLPTSCVDWYVAYAFCIWDGGRLPTEAEWNFAAAGGGGSDGQRYYPWSVPSDSQTIDNSYAVYETSAASAVGSRSPKGDSKWGHADMAGNMGEMVLDFDGDLPPCTGAQHDCANLTPNANNQAEMRGGYFTNFASYSTITRSYQDRKPGWFAAGFRCAYNQ